mgnify:CR=1 FL=1
MKYTNPILPGFYPDPSVCRVGDDFYMVTSSFEYFPGVPVFHSQDLVHWQQIGHCLTRQSQLNLEGAKASGGIYAPTIRYHDGRFYMITTDTTGIGNFIVHTEDPAGEWSDPIQVNHGGIDPSLFWDDDGTCYYASNALWMPRERGCYVSPINIETGQLQWPKSKLLWSGIGGKYPEAPHIYKKDGWYYLIIAEGGTEFGHMISVARSRAVDGPYESCPHNPLLSHRSTANPIQSTGHGDFFEDAQGDWWVVFLGVRHSSYPLVHHMGRETYLAPVTWTEDGWPLINEGRLVDINMVVDRAGPEQLGLLNRDFRDDFSSVTLDFRWNFCRNPQPDSWRVGQAGGGLQLQCLPEDLDGIGPKAWLGLRQQHFYTTAETELDFAPSNQEEAGLTAYMNERYHAEISVVADGHGGRAICLRKRCGELRTEQRFDLSGKGAVKLRIVAEEEHLHFEHASEGSTFTEVGTMETRALSTEMAGGFTGLYWALYATSNGVSGKNSATFRNFDYQPSYHDKEWDRYLEPVTAAPVAD